MPDEKTPIFNAMLTTSPGMLNLYDTDPQVRAWFDKADIEIDEARPQDVNGEGGDE